MFKTAVIFRFRADALPSAAQLEPELNKRRFVDCGASQMESYGWVRPRGEKHSPLVESVGGEYILHLMTESKVLPAAVIKDELAKRLARIERDTGKRPKGKFAKEIKKEVIDSLLPKAFTKKKTTRMWLCPSGQFIVVEAGTVKAAERIISELHKAVTELDLSFGVGELRPINSPALSMSTWLTTQEAPSSFTYDRECELKSPMEDKASVRYSRHTLEIHEVVEHIKQGKVPTKLAMTYDSRVSFILDDKLALKKIELLDVVLDDAGADKSGFDADVAIFTGELTKLIPDLINALGGEKED